MRRLASLASDALAAAAALSRDADRDLAAAERAGALGGRRVLERRKNGPCWPRSA